ncbi:hypothetical protein Tfer_2766 [Thermincola ferriacetica]|uniref:Uncharacterized protein n=1 Tax=Thermincola ferriacetica TaxID=281456 RepID=A0A0L6W0R5_9FIRM|nr:hypothetical protein [Thermincola ferriacetica]KNZ68674.1 hypothetical protein Tfer_2766 [Thermincola ferriacetica]
MQKGFVVTILCLLLIFALPLMARAETLLDPAPVPAGTADQTPAQAPAPTVSPDGKTIVSSGSPYRTVTPEEFSGKINTLTGEVKQSLDKIVVPVSEVVVVILLLALLVGSLFGIKVVRKYALAGLGFSALALVLYYSIPSIMGFINHVAKVLNS